VPEDWGGLWLYGMQNMVILLSCIIISSDERVITTAEQIRELGAEAIIVYGDISKEKDCIRIFETLEQLQCIPMIIVNNAGVFPEKSDAQRYGQYLLGYYQQY
jgi:NAD(P)-dependent dehydrogenase (short-subunit alcohol dehydrogenase family)